MDGDGLKEFQNNLKKVSSFANPILITAMEKAQVLVVNDARRDHRKYPKDLKKGDGHPDDRYYTHSGKLTNSIRPGEVKAGPEFIIGEVKAGDNSMTPYAAFVESRFSYLELALENESGNITRLFADAVKEVLK